MKFMWSYVKKYKFHLFLTLFSVIGFILNDLGIPTLMALAINNGFLKGDINYVLKIAVYMGLITISGTLLNLIGTVGASYITSHVTRDIRDDLFSKIQTFSHDEYNLFSVSRLITNTTNDPFQIMLFLQMALRGGLLAPAMFISSFLMMLSQSPKLSLSVLVALPIVILGVLFIERRSTKYSTESQATLDDINTNMRESLTGLRVIRAFNNQQNWEDKFNAVNLRYAKITKKLTQLLALGMPVFFFVFTLVLSLVMWAGAKQVDTGAILPGTLAAFVEYIFHMLFSAMLFAMIFISYPRANVSAKRIRRVMDSLISISENEDGVRETETSGYVEFDNVSFAYSDNAEEPVLREISFTAKPGEVVAFIGSTGSGKSTLIQLIPRFHDITEGHIRVDGVDIRDYYLPALRSKIGYVPQKALLFSGTVAENIRYGKQDATLDEVREASRIAQADAFIMDTEKGYDHYLEEAGSNLSGGQKQRLSIARAVVRRPSIYVFDDSFSALDFATDAKLRSELSSVTQNSAVLIVAQRVGTIMNADKIIVLNEGEIIGMGTHKELLHDCPIYYDIAASQLSKEELL